MVEAPGGRIPSVEWCKRRPHSSARRSDAGQVQPAISRDVHESAECRRPILDAGNDSGDSPRLYRLRNGLCAPAVSSGDVKGTAVRCEVQQLRSNRRWRINPEKRACLCSTHGSFMEPRRSPPERMVGTSNVTAARLPEPAC